MAKNHWYPRYIGDYLRKTAHLSLMEHGAYAVLLDWYYSNHSPLPASAMQVHRICRAFASDEQAAVDTVLHTFFELREDGWHNRRADEEIAKRMNLGEKRQKAAEKRWCKSNASAYASASVLHSGLHTQSQSQSDIRISVAKATSPPKADYSDGFNEFWERYPKNGASKKSTNQSYTRAIKEGADHETIIRGVAAYTGYAERTGTPIAHATTWLNQQRWTVDYDNLHDRARPGGQHQADSPHDRMGRAWAKAAGVHPGGQGD